MRIRRRPKFCRKKLTMFLASSDILGPVARVSFLVVEEAADAKLLGRGAVPASPELFKNN